MNVYDVVCVCSTEHAHAFLMGLESVGLEVKAVSKAVTENELLKRHGIRHKFSTDAEFASVSCNGRQATIEVRSRTDLNDIGNLISIVCGSRSVVERVVRYIIEAGGRIVDSRYGIEGPRLSGSDQARVLRILDGTQQSNQ